MFYALTVFDTEEKDIYFNITTKKGGLCMKYNMWKVILVFSVMLMFAFTGELAAQIADEVILNPSTASVSLNGSTDLTARLDSSGTGVDGEWMYFDLIPGLGELDDDDVLTSGGGYAEVTYTAGTVAGTDTLIAWWTDEESESRLTLADTSIITVNPGAATSLNVLPDNDPIDTFVVVVGDVPLVAELWDDYDNHVDATSPTQLSFSTSGLGTFGSASVNGETGCIEVTYTTDDSMATDTITTELLSNHTKDYTFIETFGAAPATMHIYANDSTVVVSNNSNMEYIWFYLYDEYGNPSAYANYYPEGDPTMYKVAFTVSSGGGVFEWDTVAVNEWGLYDNGYYSSTVVGVYTVTGTSVTGTATDDLDITQTPDNPDSLVLTPDSVAIAAGTDTTLTAEAFDQYGNHINITSTGWVSFSTDRGLHNQGYLGSAYLDSDNGTLKIAYTCDPYQADTAHVFAQFVTVRSQYYDTVTIFSAEPGDFDHYAISISEGADTANVSDGDYYETNWIRIEAQDANNIRLYTYDNADTVTLTLNESSADSSQVTWFTYPLISGELVPDTIGVGINAFLLPESFNNGVKEVGIANQVAETATVTATDTAGHTGTSPGLTWLPIDVVGFTVGIEGGLTTITAIDDTVNMEVTAIDMFGNTTGVGLPRNVILSATRPVTFLSGETQLMTDQVSLFPMVATQQASDLILRIADIATPSINGSSGPIIVNPSGIEEGPVVSSISASFGSGDISYAVAADGEVSIKVYNKVGMQVGSLVDGAVSRGYYQASLKALNLSSDVYFVVMQGPGINKKIKATLIK
jgi:hypothetical protein